VIAELQQHLKYIVLSPLVGERQREGANIKTTAMFSTLSPIPLPSRARDERFI